SNRGGGLDSVSKFRLSCGVVQHRELLCAVANEMDSADIVCTRPNSRDTHRPAFRDRRGFWCGHCNCGCTWRQMVAIDRRVPAREWLDRKSTRLNSSHVAISYAVFCLKKK